MGGPEFNRLDDRLHSSRNIFPRSYDASDRTGDGWNTWFGAVVSPKTGSGMGRLVGRDQHNGLDNRPDPDAWFSHLRRPARRADRIDAGDIV